MEDLLQEETDEYFSLIDFADIVPGKSTVTDVMTIDPNTTLFMFAQDPASQHPTQHGQYICIRYSYEGAPDFVVVSMEVRDKPLAE